MDTIELKLDEDNELSFSVVIEGTRGEPAKVRFVIEDNNMSVAFPGHTDSSGEVKVDVPSLKKIMSEGTYKGKLEVIAEDRFFEPLKFNVDLKQSLKVEATISTDKKKVSSGISVIAKSTVKTLPKKSIKVENKNQVDKKKPLKDITSNLSKLAEKYNVSESDVRHFVRDFLKKS